MGNQDTTILDNALAAHLLSRLAMLDVDLANKTGLGGELEGYDDAGSLVAIEGAEDRVLRQCVQDAASMIATAAGIPCVVNPGEDEVLDGAGVIVIDSHGLDDAFYAQVLDRSLKAARDQSAVVCFVGNGLANTEVAPQDFRQAVREAGNTTLIVGINPSPAAMQCPDSTRYQAQMTPAPRAPRP